MQTPYRPRRCPRGSPLQLLTIPPLPTSPIAHIRLSLGRPLPALQRFYSGPQPVQATDKHDGERQSTDTEPEECASHPNVVLDRSHSKELDIHSPDSMGKAEALVTQGAAGEELGTILRTESGKSQALETRTSSRSAIARWLAANVAHRNPDIHSPDSLLGKARHL